MHFKTSSVKWRPFCLGLNMLMLTLLVLTLDYSRRTRSIPQQLMPWPLASPGNHQSWYWLRRVIASPSTTRTHLNNRSGRYAEQYYTSLSFISVDAPYKTPIRLKSFLWIFPYPNLIKKPMGFDVPNGVNIKVRTVYLAFQILLQFQDPQSDHQVLRTFFEGV